MAPSPFDEYTNPIEPEIDDFSGQENHPFQAPTPIWPSPLTPPLDEEPWVTQKGAEWIQGSRILTLALLSSLVLVFVVILLLPILKLMVWLSKWIWNLV